MHRQIISLPPALVLQGCAGETHRPEPDPNRTQAWNCEISGYLVTTGNARSASLWLFLPVTTGKGTLKLEPDHQAEMYSGEGVTLSIASHDQTLTVLIEGKACSDSMSGLSYETTVSVTLNEKNYPGCGKTLH